MASPVEVKPGPERFGAKRFVVRGRIYAPEQDTVRVVDLIDDIPERWPLNPLFPQPGRRGGSRPRAENGQLPARDNVFPIDRTRNNRDPDIPTGGLPQPNAPEASGPNACIGQGGTVLEFSDNVPATTIRTQVSLAIPFPFVIAHVWALGAGVITDNMRWGVKVSNENSDVDDFTVQGVSISEFTSGTPVALNMFGVPYEFYPNFRVPFTGWYIKVILSNQTAAAKIMNVGLSIHRID